MRKFILFEKINSCFGKDKKELTQDGDGGESVEDEAWSVATIPFECVTNGVDDTSKNKDANGDKHWEWVNE